MSIRVQGKAGFAHLQQAGQRLQIYVRKDDVGEDMSSPSTNSSTSATTSASAASSCAPAPASSRSSPAPSQPTAGLRDHTALESCRAPSA